MIYEFGQNLQKNLQELMGSSNKRQIDSIVNEIIRNLVSENINMNQIIELKKKIDSLIKTKDFNSQKNVKSMLNETKKQIYGIIYNHLIETMKPKETIFSPQKNKQNIVMFVGLQGAGKTTSICKYAHFYKQKGYKVGIICADTFRSGAFDQIKQNAAKIDVPSYGNSEEKDFIKIATEGINYFKRQFFDLILVDTSGRHTHDEDLFNDMKEMVDVIRPNEITFVMDAGIGVAAEEQARGFKKAVPVGSIILTKMDGAEKSGGALSAVAASGCPVSFVGMGEDMNDLEPFNAERFISKILGQGDLETLAEKMEEAEFDKEIDPNEFMDNFTSGNLSLNNYKQTMKAMKKLGPIGSLMKMFPGFSKMSHMIDENMIRKTEAVINSLTKKELKGTGAEILNSESRRKRIAMGSGVSEKNVIEFIEHMRNTNSQLAKMSQSNLFEKMASGNFDMFQ